jgi:hypothetical protein
LSRGFKDKPSGKYKEAVRILHELIEAEGGDTASRACAEAMADDLQRWYAEKKHRRWTDDEVKVIERDSHVCIHRLRGARRCPDSHKEPCGLGGEFSQFPCADHLSEWRAGDETVSVVSQPYNSLGLESLREIIAFCEANGFQVDVSAASWHFLGHTLRIEYSRQKESER